MSAKLLRRRAAACLFLLGVLTLPACESNFLDVNVDPDNPTFAPAATLLAQAELGIANSETIDFNLYGALWSQQWAQGTAASQYANEEIFIVTGNTFNRGWQRVYDALNDLRQVTQQAQASGNTRLQGVAGVLRVYGFLLLTDAYGDIPYTEALQGETGNTAPRYDDQFAIYQGLLTELNTAIEQLQNGTGVIGGDQLLGGNAERWYQFANSLKLRMALRQWYANQGWSQQVLGQLSSLPATAFLQQDVAFRNFSDTPGQFSTWWGLQQQLGSGNLRGNETLVDSLYTPGGFADPRLQGLFLPAQEPVTVGGNDAIYRGVPAGLRGSGGPTAGYSQTETSEPGPAVVAPTAPLYYMTVAETRLLLAEAAVRNGGTFAGQSAADWYTQGIQASFDQLAGGASATAYLAEPGKAFPASNTADAQIRRIIVEKWIALAGLKGFEAWTEYRRTGYPTLAEPLGVQNPGSGIPERFLYPANETTRNPNAAGLGGVTLFDNVDWDTN